MSEYVYTTHTFPMLDTGIGQSMGFESDKAFLAHQKAEEAKLDPEVREAVEDVRREILRALNTGTGGDTIATDDIAGVKHQLVKVEYGVADSATPVSTTNPLPVDQTNTTVADGGTLPAKGVQVGGTDGSVFQVMSTDNAGRVNTNVNGTVPVSIAATQAVNTAQVAGTTTDTNSGVKSAGTQRVVLATDQPQLTNALKVDGSAVTQPVSAGRSRAR
jgi:hypothetical protein